MAKLRFAFDTLTVTKDGATLTLHGGVFPAQVALVLELHLDPLAHPLHEERGDLRLELHPRSVHDFLDALVALGMLKVCMLGAIPNPLTAFADAFRLRKE